MNIVEVGLIIIAVAWLAQLILSWKGNKEISPIFIVGYMLGVGLLIISGYLANIWVSPFEAFTFVAAGIVLFRVLTIKNVTATNPSVSKIAGDAHTHKKAHNKKR